MTDLLDTFSQDLAHAAMAAHWGVPVGVLVRKGDTLPGHSKKAPAHGYYTPYSAWRPPSGRCLFVGHVLHGDGKGHYYLSVLSEDTTGHGSFAGINRTFSLSELKAYLKGVADGAAMMPRPKRRR